MMQLASRSALVLVLVLAATGCTASAASVQSPAKTGSSCTRTGDAEAERECLRRVLADLADLDSNDVGAPRRTASSASQTLAR